MKVNTLLSTGFEITTKSRTTAEGSDEDEYEYSEDED